MNNDLNMQVIEQLTTITLGKSLDMTAYCQSLFDLLKTHIRNLKGLTIYRQVDGKFDKYLQFPTMNDEAETLTRESHESVLITIMENKAHIDTSQAYLPIQHNEQIYALAVVYVEVEDEDQFPNISWTVLQNIITREMQHILSHDQTSVTDMSEQVKIQEALNEMSTFAGSNQDEIALLNKGAETLLKVLDIDHVGIMLIDEDGEFGDLVVDIPPSETSIRRIPVEGNTWGTLAKGEHILIEDTSTAKNIATSSKKSLEAIGVQSSLFLPLRDLSGKLIGSIGLDTVSRKIDMKNEMIQVANLVVTQLVTQLQNLRLLQDTQRLAGQMQHVAKYSETVQSRLQISEILQTTLHFVNRIVTVDYVAIVLYNPSSQQLGVNAYRLADKDTISPSSQLIMPTRETLTGQVWTTREAGYVRRLVDSPYHNPIATEIESLYAVPLISRGNIQGVLEVGAKQRGINRTDRSLLSQVANQLAVALENANTTIQSQRLAENKTLANEIALQLQQQMDMDSLLNTTVTELGKALGAKRARIRLGVHQAVSNN